MNYESALGIFQHTLANADRDKPDIHRAMLAMATKAQVEVASLQVTNALALGERVWLTSDLHLCHGNVIVHCNRPFSTTQAMNDALMSQLRKIPEDDLLIIVGDVAMGNYVESVELIRQIPGRKILVAGNHDITPKGKCRLQHEPDLFEHSVPFLFWTGQFTRDVIATHYPVSLPASYRGAHQLQNYHGHLHALPFASTEKVKYMNVGWDVSYSLRCL